MAFFPEDELKGRTGLNMAPMVDFLFLMLMFFASLAITRATAKSTDIALVEIKPETTSTFSETEVETKSIHISIDAQGKYKWITEIQDHEMKDPKDIANELELQYEKGLLPEAKSQTHVFLKIDKQATWEPILKAIFAIREAGFDVRPVYEPESDPA